MMGTISKSDIFIEAIKLCVDVYIYDGSKTDGGQVMYARHAYYFLESLKKEIYEKFELDEDK